MIVAADKASTDGKVVLTATTDTSTGGGAFTASVEVKVKAPKNSNGLQHKQRKQLKTTDDNAQTDGNPPQAALTYVNASTLTVGGRAFADTLSFWNRLPARAQGKVQPPGVWGLSTQSAGISVSFETDATTIGVRYTLTGAGIDMVRMMLVLLLLPLPLLLLLVLPLVLLVLTPSLSVAHA